MIFWTSEKIGGHVNLTWSHVRRTCRIVILISIPVIWRYEYVADSNRTRARASRYLFIVLCKYHLIKGPDFQFETLIHQLASFYFGMKACRCSSENRPGYDAEMLSSLFPWCQIWVYRVNGDSMSSQSLKNHDHLEFFQILHANSDPREKQLCQIVGITFQFFGGL